MLNITVFYGSVRETRQGIKAAKFVMNKLKERNHNVTFIDAKEYNLPFIDKRYKEYEPGQAPEKIEGLAEIIRNSDGFIIVSGEYNHGMPPALKNIMDYFQKEYFFRPSGIVTYSGGPFGGVRVLPHVREVVAEMGMPSISSSFPVPKVWEFKDDGTPNDPSYNDRIKRFLDEFEWYSNALKDARSKGTPY